MKELMINDVLQTIRDMLRETEKAGGLSEDQSSKNLQLRDIREVNT
jgi:hypothetical protein